MTTWSSLRSVSLIHFFFVCFVPINSETQRSVVRPVKSVGLFRWEWIPSGPAPGPFRPLFLSFLASRRRTGTIPGGGDLSLRASRLSSAAADRALFHSAGAERGFTEI